ncbi:DnaD domain protein [Secundilactobacillus collinoides]|uniref:XRE family transcriptional regulator n=1 Tax=Secundilactobacillus collinoides TaxID=33960 RepID=A0A166H1W4_SECCO|nr:DnaD domain protein [Secundilactobacillus collinoides]KZL41153.1 XRE family transcriptional regulator [Secundilactobacillus collinoides]
MDAFTSALLASGNTVVSTLLLRHYRDLGMTNEQFLIYLQLKSFADHGNAFPPSATVGQAIGLSENQVFQSLHEMISKNLMQIKTTHQKDQLAQDSYDFTQLYEKLAQFVVNKETANVKETATNDRQVVFKQVESEFGRPLSPIELETIAQWLDEDHYSGEMIQLALKEAVLSQVYNLKYMDRILLSWEKKHITTPEQVQQEKDRHQGNTRNNGQGKSGTKGADTSKIPDIPLFNIGDQSDSTQN